VESEAAVIDREVRALVNQFAAALDGRNIAALSRLYPTMPRSAREGYQALFDERFARDLRVTYRVDNVNVTRAGGTVRVTGQHRFMQQNPRKQCEIPVAMDLRVASTGGAWRITGIQQVGSEARC
jgi:hypothetical protein